jgi:hypothetical protein
MKKIGTLLLLVGFAGMAVFGLFVMDFAMGHNDTGCIASSVSGGPTVCPMSLLQMAFHHISAFQAFSLAIVAGAFNVLLALASLSLVFVFTRWLANAPPKFLRRIRRRENKFSYFQFQKITRWLSLFEHSPSLI